MKLGYDARYARWRAAVMARQMQSGYPREEHLLLALLEQPTVVQALESCGADIAALKGAAASAAARYRFDTHTYSETMAAYQALFDQEAVGSIDSRHLLATLARSNRILRDISPGALERLQPRQVEAIDWRERLVTDGWDELSTNSPNWGRYPLSLHRESLLVAELLEAGDLALVAHLYESMGTVNGLLYRSMPDEGRYMGTFPAQFLVLGAHFYRQAGEHERAAFTARRAAWEIEQRLQTLPAASEQVPYLHELLADATVCWDSATARTGYTTAITLFGHLDRTTQQAEEAEDFGWGGLHSLQARYFLDGTSHHNGATRIQLKMSKWL